MPIGEQIKDRREALACSKEELAQAVNGSVQQVSRWEKGISYPNIKQLIAISDRLELSLDNLIKSDPKLQKTIQIDKNAKEASDYLRISLIFSFTYMILFSFAALVM